MNAVLKVVLSLSVSGSLLISALLFCKPLYRNRISKRWQYYIWLVVLARLLLPFTPEVSLIGALFQEEPAAAQADTPTGGTFLPSEPEDFTILPPEYGADLLEPAPGGSPPSFTFSLSQALANLWLVWLCAALVLLVRKITVYQSFVRYVKAGRTEVSDPLLLDRLAQLGESVGVKRPVELYVNPLVSSPLLVGFFRPCIVLPSAELPEADFRCTLLHELTHCKRRDLCYKWLVQLAVCVHWFNPLVYWMAREIARMCELSCDEAVIRTLTPQERRAYGETLLNAAGAGGSYRNTLASVTLHESAEQLKERLSAIMSYQKKSKWVAGVSFLLAALTITGGVAAGAYNPQTASEASEPRGVIKSESQPYLLSFDAKDRWIVGEETNTDLPSILLKEGDVSGMVTLAGSNFTRNSYYQLPYVFDIGYNLPENWKKDYSSKTLSLSGSSMTVYYGDSCKAAMQTAKTVQALSTLLTRLRDEKAGTEFAVVCPVVYSVENIGNTTPSVLVKRYYDDGELSKFGGIFALLDQNEQKSWLNTLMDDGKIAFFSLALQNLPVNSPLISTIAERAYAENIAFFSVTTQYMSQEELEDFLTRAVRDQNTSLRAMLLQKLGKDDEYEAWKEELDQQRLAEYRAQGITQSNGAFYYKGQRVRILLDMRKNNQSFVTLQTDPEGTADIQILRDASDNIQSVTYMTADEVKAVFGDSWEVDIMEPDGWDAESDPDDKALSPSRLTRAEAPEPVRTALNTCGANKWYRIQYAGRQYVYYNGLPSNYNWEPIENDYQLQINIRDMGTAQAADRYVLLSIPSTFSLRVSYNGKAVSFADVLNLNSYDGSVIPTYAPDADKTITIPVSIPAIGAGKCVCVGAIPNVSNETGKSWLYDFTVKNGRGLFVGMAYDSGRTDKADTWYNYSSSDTETWNPFESKRLYSRGTQFGSNTTSGDTFYLYVGSSSQALEAVEGTITIQYK